MSDDSETIEVVQDDIVEIPTLPSTGVKRKISTSSESPWHDTISVIVGETKKEFSVHAHILRKVPFFRACLDNPMRESIVRIIHLPDDAPEVIQEMVHWLYHGKLEQDFAGLSEGIRGTPTGSAEGVQRLAAERLLISLWLLAKKYMVEELQNVVIDSIRAGSKSSIPGSRGTQMIIDNCQADDSLHKLTLQRFSCRMHSSESFEDFKTAQASYLGQFAKRGQEPWQWLLEAHMDYPYADNPAEDLNACKWHVHVDSEKCQPQDYSTW